MKKKNERLQATQPENKHHNFEEIKRLKNKLKSILTFPKIHFHKKQIKGRGF